MAGYTKLFNSILASTIWEADMATRIVWITLLAMADKDGVAEASVPGLATFARVSRQECERALSHLMAPDKDSRSKEYEGRRIEAIDGGWRLLNHAKYRAKLNADERREYLRVKQQEYRRKQKPSTNVNNVSDKSTVLTQAEAEAEADTKIKSKGETSDDFEKFWSAYPRKVGKKAAWTKWRLLNPDDGLVETILSAVAKQAESSQWHKDGGAFIPHPTTWLNQGRWEDEPLNVASTPAVDPVLAKRAADLKRIYG